MTSRTRLLLLTAGLALTLWLWPLPRRAFSEPLVIEPIEGIDESSYGYQWADEEDADIVLVVQYALPGSKPSRPTRHPYKRNPGSTIPEVQSLCLSVIGCGPTGSGYTGICISSV